MNSLLGSLKEYFKPQEITTDNIIFRLHSTFTTVMLMTCSLIITANQHVGNPIECTVNSNLPIKPINTFCWVTSTFTMPDAFRRQELDKVALPGIGNDYGDEDAKKYYSYYQWVCFVLFFQSILCYTPKFLWDTWEGGLLKSVVMGLNTGVYHEEEKYKKKKILTDYLLSHMHTHKMYAIHFWFCEVLCLVNIILQLYLMNKFFDGEFISLGLQVIGLSEQAQEDRIDPMVYIFPKVTKCLFYKYGSSGSIQKYDSLCLLPLNAVNEKTYIIIWFWFLILLTILLLLLVYRVMTFFLPRLRLHLLHSCNSSVSYDDLAYITRKMDIGDWWLLCMLVHNMDPLTYREVITDLAKKIKATAVKYRDPHDRICV